MKNFNNEFQLSSKIANYTYSIQVYLPEGSPPSGGFPIIYVLDGLWYFDYAKQVVRLQSPNTLRTRIESSIVVGIGHDVSDQRDRRFVDFTAEAEQYIFPKHAREKLMDRSHYGGASLFYQFMEEELKPLIEERYPVNRKKQTLFGHSLAGYYTLLTYLTHSEDFQTYIAFSPSIWWNDKELYHYLKKANPEKLQNLFIAVGEREGFMVQDAQAFCKELPEQSYHLVVALDENHASVVPASMSRAFRYILGE